MKKTRESTQAKISPEFSARLARLGPREMIRAVVMLRTEDAGVPSGRRQSHGNRQAVIAAVRESAEQALGDVDRILKRFHGQRLVANPDVLGCVPVETNPAGLTALAASDHVEVILEDQAVSRLP